MPGVRLAVCRACATEAFPPPLACPSCGGQDFDVRRMDRGVVEEAVAVHRSVGGGGGATIVRLATVRVGDVAVVAGMDEALAPGTTVTVHERRGVVRASRCRPDLPATSP